MRENLNKFEKCREDFETQSANLHRELTEITAKALLNLESLREMMSGEIEFAVRETSENACRSDYQPQTYLAGLIWSDCCYQNPDPLPVFDYTVRTGIPVEDCLGVSFQTIPHLAGLNFLCNGGNEELQTRLRQAEKLLDESRERNCRVAGKWKNCWPKVVFRRSEYHLWNSVQLDLPCSQTTLSVSLTSRLAPGDEKLTWLREYRWVRMAHG